MEINYLKKLFFFFALIFTLLLPLELDAKTERSEKQRAAFQRENPCPSTGKTKGACPGYIVDHIVPLKRGGTDTPCNMQWQTKEDAKEKDKWE
jgi:hypothetical protein